MNTNFKHLLAKYNEGIAYIIFGILTVIVNTVAFMLCSNFFGILEANTIAFFIAVLFAYFTNTKYVFKTKNTLKKFIAFLGMRLFTLIFDNLGMLILINMGIDELISKISVNFLVILLNYIFSKFMIFKN
ncbi:TPA: GtrA family protein [Clostridioides difficile]|uniref:GtrA family protein n=1 Tax=Clostridioides difficile TaxID=1496 RepID=UPI001C2832D7|nr:GtrA family protein [Clostridioides difficile]MCJ0223478.1 GtrA family protein [Clostridioides difficile]MCJ0431014.1 GtrA family protein [Clostridioides difficile]MCJ0437629.1 GtrA family protein [Clostridioides difficile]MCU6147412.1 GtrA family protein [Clostridioides difficile]MDN4815919.1 GtrA family protein [Clostridioides difficile]